jgi:hypothetical protein
MHAVSPLSPERTCATLCSLTRIGASLFSSRAS